MKRIGCIGEIKSDKSTGLSEAVVSIFNELRVFNNEYSINGVFLVFQNVVLQILEGETHQVASAIYKLGRDPRLNNVTILFNNDTGSAYFSSWKVRFLQSSSKSHKQYLDQLYNDIFEDVDISDAEAKERVDQLFFRREGLADASLPETEAHSIGRTIITLKDLYKMEFGITGWPKPGQLTLTPQVMKACSLLSKSPLSYRGLVSRQVWATEKELDVFLGQMLALGLIRLTGSKANDVQGGALECTPPVKDRFGQLMKRFLTSNRQRSQVKYGQDI